MTGNTELNKQIKDKRTAQPKLLIVDDNRSFLETCVEFFSEEGFTVDQAASGNEALSLLAESNYDVILSDIAMPGLSGIDLLEHIRNRGIDTPVILVTAYGSLDTAVKALKQGVFDFILKPVNMEDLLMRVQKSLEFSYLMQEKFELYEQLREKEKQERAKDEFISIISHELKTPVTIIRNYIEVIEALLQNDKDDEKIKILSIIKDQLERLRRDIHNLLFFSQVSSSEYEPAVSEVELSKLVGSVVENYRNLANEKKLLLAVEIAEGIWMKGDGRLLEMMISNLVDNAIKFSHEGTIQVSLTRLGDSIRLIVSDQGIGIPSESISKIFDRFSQLDSHMTRRHTGAGLGLAIVKNAVNTHRGKIKVDSKPGKGTTFTVTLPVDRSKINGIKR